jgi:O-antigen/teichoic acid export membrane protein
MLGLLLSAGVVAAAILIRGGFRGKSDKEERKFLIKNSLPLIPAVISRASISSLDKLTVKAYLGVNALAKYSVAHTVGTALFAIIGALSSALNPWIVRKLAGGKRQDIFPIIGEISTLIGWGAVIAITLSPEIFSFLAPEGYKDAIYVISPLALASVPYFLFTVAMVFLGFVERTRIASISAFFGATVNLALNLTLIPTVGYPGGGIAYFAAECAMALSSLILMKRWDKEAATALFGRWEIYLTFAMGGLIPFLYGYRAARILLLILSICQGIRHSFTCLELVKEK